MKQKKEVNERKSKKEKKWCEKIWAKTQATNCKNICFKIIESKIAVVMKNIYLYDLK